MLAGLKWVLFSMLLDITMVSLLLMQWASGKLCKLSSQLAIRISNIQLN
jgi:hypothetical protein